MSMSISVTFTGICVFVEHGGEATVMIPNASTIRGVTHDGTHTHVASHVAFLEFDTKQNPYVKSAAPLFSYRSKGTSYDVLQLASSSAGCELAFCGEDGGHFPAGPPDLNWKNVVAMERVTGAGYPIDDSLVDSFDPRSERVATRMRIRYGSVTPVQQDDVHATFLPSSSPPYSGQFVQEVVWYIEYSGKLCTLRKRSLGTDGKGDAIVTFNGNKRYSITIGNAPFEDIIGSGTGASDLIDQHFAIYYDFLRTSPAVMRLPHRTSQKTRRARSGASNCPPTIIPVG